MNTRTVGDTAEAAILASLTAAGLDVYLPFGRFGPCDLVAETDEGFVRIQVKSGRIRGACVEFNCVGTDHGRGAGLYAGRADVFAVHVQETGAQYVVPITEAMRTKLYLRLSPTHNGQARRIRWARDFLLTDWARSRVLTAP